MVAYTILLFELNATTTVSGKAVRYIRRRDRIFGNNGQNGDGWARLTLQGGANVQQWGKKALTATGFVNPSFGWWRAIEVQRSGILFDSNYGSMASSLSPCYSLESKERVCYSAATSKSTHILAPYAERRKGRATRDPRVYGVV